MAQRSNIPRPASLQAFSTAAREATPRTMGYQVTSCLSQRGDGQQGRDKVGGDQKVSQLLSFRLCISRRFYTFVSYLFDS